MMLLDADVAAPVEADDVVRHNLPAPCVIACVEHGAALTIHDMSDASHVVSEKVVVVSHR